MDLRPHDTFPGSPSRDARQRSLAVSLALLGILLLSTAATANSGRVLFGSARIVPVYEDGQQFGLRISKLRAGGFFVRAGFEEGDVIVAVDDILVVSPGASKRALHRLATPDAATVEVSRRGAERRRFEVTGPTLAESTVARRPAGARAASAALGVREVKDSRGAVRGLKLTGRIPGPIEAIGLGHHDLIIMLDGAPAHDGRALLLSLERYIGGVGQIELVIRGRYGRERVLTAR